MDTTSLVYGLLFGAIGLGFFIFGRKQRKPVPLVVGVILLVIPYFVSNAWVLGVVGVGLMAVAYYVRI